MNKTAEPNSKSSTEPGELAHWYWNESRRPLVSLAFILPLLVIYEGGVVALGPKAMRNGVDVWLRTFLDWIGFGQYFLLPALTISLLLSWHHLTRQPWRVSPPVLYAMALECLVLGITLVGLAHLQGSLLQMVSQKLQAITTSLGDWSGFRVLGRMIGFCGAGIYEEVLFRLLLVPMVAAAIRAGGGNPRWQILGSILVTSLLFSAAHYLGSHGERLEWFSFVFRFIAGAFFAVLFVYRGFGITAGTHALYDIMVGVF